MKEGGGWCWVWTRPHGARACALACRRPRRRLLVPGLIVREADPAADAKTLDRLALWALQRYAPIVAADAPDGLVIDATGAAHLHGGEDAMLKGMVERLAALGFAARAAIADSWGAAHAFARYWGAGRPRRSAGRKLDGHPRSADRCTSSAQKYGGGLVRPRFRAHRRTGGKTPCAACLTFRSRTRPSSRSSPWPPQRADRSGSPAGTHRGPSRLRGADRRRLRQLPATTGKLVTQLCETLEAKGLGARRLDLLFYRVDNRIEAIRIGTALPVRDVKRLTRLLCDKIETVDPGFGIEIMRLAATLAEPLAPKQMISSLTEEPEADVSGLIDTLANRVGEQRLYRFAPVASDVPERSVQRIAPAAPDTGETWPDLWPNHWPRPARLLPAPEPIETVALLPDHPPVSFTWRGVRRHVKCADGPERVFGEWWKRDAELFARARLFPGRGRGGRALLDLSRR